MHLKQPTSKLFIREMQENKNGKNSLHVLKAQNDYFEKLLVICDLEREELQSQKQENGLVRVSPLPVLH